MSKYGKKKTDRLLEEVSNTSTNQVRTAQQVENNHKNTWAPPPPFSPLPRSLFLLFLCLCHTSFFTLRCWGKIPVLPQAGVKAMDTECVILCHYRDCLCFSFQASCLLLHQTDRACQGLGDKPALGACCVPQSTNNGRCDHAPKAHP